MRADDVLDQIDRTLSDWAVSDDAMRSRPTRESGGVLSVDIPFEPPAIDPEFARRWQEMQEYIARVQVERARQALAMMEALRQAFTQIVKPAVEDAARNVAQTAAAVQQAGVCDDHGKPARPRDRPAWQSPYGPARRRR